IFIANFSGSAVSNIRQVTRTQNGSGNTNILSPGRRLSRNGALIAFESRATDPKSNAVASSTVLGVFVYTVASDTFVEIGQRPASSVDIIRFPTFTDYNGSLAPSSLIFASAQNLRPDGTVPPDAQKNEGLNPQISTQVFMTAIPAPSTGQTFVRLTNTPVIPEGGSFGGTLPVVAETHKRISFVLGGVDLGGGNGDFSQELFYLLSPIPTAQSSAVLSFFTGASNMPVTAATPVPSPTPSPTPTPSPVPGAPVALAPGELSFVRSTIALAPSNAVACVAPTGCASETIRSPALPIELNGVSVSINGAAAGLYFVGNAEKQINFVVPIGTRPGLNNVAVNILDTGANSDTMLHGLLNVLVAQPDIFTSTTDAGGRAVAFNVTNPNARTAEPFNVTSPDASGNTVATVIELSVTGMRFAARTEITVTVGTTAITGDGIVLVQPNPEMPGFDIIQFRLPAALAGAGDVPVQVSFTRAGVTTVSRPAGTAPHITIN
ncbi:MAG TPA: hypothetical protein VGW58_03640, partial [Pyrinomonadaceae bacterium]|nr:hypothetical protein [Pyrinomonadaceae bacterium]